MRRPIILAKAFTLLGEKSRKITRCLQFRWQRSTGERKYIIAISGHPPRVRSGHLIIDGGPSVIRFGGNGRPCARDCRGSCQVREKGGRSLYAWMDFQGP